MTASKLKLSVLDQALIRKGDTAGQTLHETTELARLADDLGYTRFWVAEHHNAESLASSAPEILIAHLANHTKRMRIGSGGIMLPNHSALKMAENFRMLESLFPHRIDMGIGRAPGTDRLTASLLNPSNTFAPQDFVKQLMDLDKFLKGEHNKGTIFEKVKATPMATSMPLQWMLTSSGESAMIAAHFGKPVSFAHFINPTSGKEAATLYYDRFNANDDLSMPKANVAIFAFCSEDSRKVKRQKAILDYRFLQLDKGGNLQSICYEDIADVNYSPEEQSRINYNSGRYIIGTPDEVKPRIEALARSYGVNEVMLISYAENRDDRFESHRLFAEMFDL